MKAKAIAGKLSIGDRFYFASDRKKNVWQVVKRKGYITYYSTGRKGASVNSCFSYYKEVVFLRSVEK